MPERTQQTPGPRATAAEEAPRVSVVIPAYNSEPTIRGALDALRRQSYGDFEVVVVDSSPGDATEELIGDYPEVRYHHSKARLLPHGARNKGVELARGELIAFTDPDCFAEPDWLEHLVAAHDAGHEVVGGAIEPAGGSWFERGEHLSKFVAWIGGGEPGGRVDLASANLLWSREAWERFGPLPTDRWCGDTELSWRALDAGITPWFEPAASMSHVHEADFRGYLRERHGRGDDFASMRQDTQGWSRARAALQVLAAPVVPFLLLGRALRQAAAAGRLGWALSAAPVLFPGYVAWAAGEARAHAGWALGRRGG